MHGGDSVETQVALHRCAIQEEKCLWATWQPILIDIMYVATRVLLTPD